MREPRASSHQLPFSERHLQCVWYDPRLRPADLRTHQGERLEVEDPGTWNLESGPDFLGAAVRVGPGRRRLCGDVEIHIRPQGWVQHGHHTDARYRSVRVHVTYFPGLVPESDLPAGALQLSLMDPLRRNPRFSFEAVDTSAYPYAVRARVPPCAGILQGWNRDGRRALLSAAGEERIRRKRERLRERMEERRPAQALYEEILGALGYKHNKWSARRLAEELPLAELRQCADGRPDRAYALLMGLGGLLPGEPAPDWTPAAKRFLRRCWGEWWRHRDEMGPRAGCIPPWHLSGLRPANHPNRRLMAAAVLFTRTPLLEMQWEEAAVLEPLRAVEAASASLEGISHSFWSHHTSWGSARRPAGETLLGRERIRGILGNVFIPFLAARASVPLDRVAEAVPAAETNRVIRATAQLLFGPDHSPSLYRDGLHRQGLQHIFEDYCLVDRSRCASCPLPAALAETAPDPR